MAFKQLFVLGIILAVAFSGCTARPSPPPYEPMLCMNDSDCSSYCGNNECLRPICKTSDYEPNSTSKYCDCLGMCGVKSII